VVSSAAGGCVCVRYALGISRTINIGAAHLIPQEEPRLGPAQTEDRVGLKRPS
jgi:hypothetical protein